MVMITKPKGVLKIKITVSSCSLIRRYRYEVSYHQIIMNDDTHCLSLKHMSSQ